MNNIEIFGFSGIERCDVNLCINIIIEVLPMSKDMFSSM